MWRQKGEHEEDDEVKEGLERLERVLGCMTSGEQAVTSMLAVTKREREQGKCFTAGT